MKINFIILFIFIFIFLFSCQMTEQEIQSLRKEQHEKCGDNKYDGLTVHSQIVRKNRHCDRISNELFNLEKKLEREGKELPPCNICGSKSTICKN